MKTRLIVSASIAIHAGAVLGFTGALPDGKVIDTTPVRAAPVLQELKGVLSWTTLADVRSVRQKDRIVPEFSPRVTALDKTQVKMQGFMIPLEAGVNQKRFLLSSTTSTCEFCLPGGPETLVEVQAKVAVKWTDSPVIVSGRFVLAGNDADGVLYRLVDAEPSAP